MKVALIMGSTSDIAKVEPTITILKDYGVNVNVRCLSAHRAHSALIDFVNECKDTTFQEFIQDKDSKNQK